MITAFLSPETVRAEMDSRYGLHTETQRPGSSLHVIRWVRARVKATTRTR
ncbi:hypothetical protein V6K52_00505 [Knoellia sp. S7-12]